MSEAVAGELKPEKYPASLRLKFWGKRSWLMILGLALCVVSIFISHEALNLPRFVLLIVGMFVAGLGSPNVLCAHRWSRASMPLEMYPSSKKMAKPLQAFGLDWMERVVNAFFDACDKEEAAKRTLWKKEQELDDLYRYQCFTPEEFRKFKKDLRDKRQEVKLAEKEHAKARLEVFRRKGIADELHHTLRELTIIPANHDLGALKEEVKARRKQTSQ